MPLDSSKFLLLLATPLIFGSPATLAAENVSPIANPPVLAQTTEERKAEADRLLQLGRQQARSSQFREALQSFETALQIYREIRDRTGEGSVLDKLGMVYIDLEQYTKSIEFFEQALVIAREILHRNGEASVLKNLGNAYESLGQYEKASEFYEQSLSIAREIGDRRGEANSLGHLGQVYRFLGQYERANEFYEQSLSIAREIGDRSAEAMSLNGVGSIYFVRGQYERASEFIEQSLKIAREIGSRGGEANALMNLGNAYDFLGQHERASEFYKQSLSIAREIGDRRGEANALGSLGNAYRHLDQYERSIAFYEQSLSIAREIGDRRGEANSLGSLGIAYNLLGQHENAIEFYQASLPIFQEIGNRYEEANALSNLGALYNTLGEYERATDTLLASIEIYESLRYKKLPDEAKIAFYDTQSRSYRHLQRSLIAQNQIETALEISERGRARAFVELMAQRLHGDADEEFIPPAPPNLADIQQVARTQNATLIEYSVASNKSLYIWVIQPTGDITFRQVNLDSLDTPLAQLVTQSRATIGVRSLGIVATYPSPEEIAARQTRHLQQLHQLLIEPIADLLPANPESPVVFIPHQSLFLVPFPALINADGEYLIQNHTILTAPSIQVLELTNSEVEARNSERGEVLVVGNPTMPSIWNPNTDETQRLSNLPGAQSEAVAIAELFNTQPLLGDDATETSITERMPTAQIIHLATHGLLDYGIPEETGVRDFPGAIALAQGNGEDGLLTSAELLEMNLNAELVVLSACDTGRGTLSSDGVIGLSRALIGAGVPNVMVSLWAVPDAPTADLMVEFYQQWQATGNKAQALRSAMLTTIETHPQPRNWAAFTLVGLE